MSAAETRPGISLVISAGSVAEVVEAGRLAEEAGFDSAWTTEFYDRSATISLAALAGATARMTLGSAIAYAFGRTPVVWAAEARDLDEVCDGRLIIGLGTGTRRMQQDWHGLDGEHPAARVEELIPLIRRLMRLHEGPVNHDGRFYRVHCHPTVPVAAPPRAELPIYLAGVNPRMVQAAGTVGDGLIGHPLFTPEYTRDVVRPALARGAERARRDAPVPVAGYVTCSVGEDREAARNAARAVVAFNSTVKTYRVVHDHHGFGNRAEEIRRRWQAGEFAAAVEVVDDEMLDTIALAGTPDEVRGRYDSRWAGVYERTLLWAPTLIGPQGARALVDCFAA